MRTALLLAMLAAPGSVNTRLGDTEEKQADRMFLEVLSCEALDDLGNRLAEQVLADEKELAKPRCHFLRKVDPICRAYDVLRAEHMQSLADVDDAGVRRCGWLR